MLGVAEACSAWLMAASVLAVDAVIRWESDFPPSRVNPRSPGARGQEAGSTPAFSTTERSTESAAFEYSGVNPNLSLIAW